MSQWEQLVTEGHVRAARWRSAAPLVVAIAVLSIIVGAGIIAALPRPTPSLHALAAKQKIVTAEQQVIERFIQDKGAPPQTLPQNAENAIAARDSPNLIDRLSLALGQSGQLPGDTASTPPETFWQGAWTPGATAAVRNGRSILIGYFVDTAFRPQPARLRTAPILRRVFGLFRRSQNNANIWTFYCLSVPGAYPCGRGDSIEPAAIPATMRGLMPDSAFAPQKVPP